MSLWRRPTLVFVIWVVCCPLRLRAGAAVIQSTDSNIQYTGVWEAVRVNSTTAYVVSNTTGSRATYTFAGTRISVFGVVLPQDSSAGQASVYSIDGGTLTQYTAPGNATGPVYNLQFYQSGQLRDGQHTLTIVNLGDEFVIGHLEVTTDGTHIGSTSLNSGSVATTSQRPSTTSTPSSTFLPSTTTHSSTTSSISNTTLTSTNSTSIVSSTFPPTNTSSATSSTLILPTSSSSRPPDSTPRQDHATTLSKGATIGGGIAGTLGFLFLVGGLCWWGQRRGIRRRKRQEASIQNVPKPPLGMHNVTSQMTVGSDPFASDATRRHRAPPIYIPVSSTTNLSAGGTQYTSTQGYQSEKYAMYDAPLYSPASTSNLLGSPIHYAFPTPSPRLPETPVEVRRIDPDGRRRSADGGVRIAGGRPGQRVEDTDDSFLDLASRKSTGSTLPPAYDFD